MSLILEALIAERKTNTGLAKVFEVIAMVILIIREPR